MDTTTTAKNVGGQHVSVDVLDEDIVDIDDPTKEASEWLNKFGKFIPKIFCGLGIICVILFIAGLAGPNDVFWGIVISCFLLSILGTWTVYKYGSVSEHIDRLKHENEQYEGELKELSQTRVELGNEVSKLRAEVEHLQGDANELAKQAEEFNDLRKELEKIAGDNQDLFDVINKTNSIFDDMRQTVLENERAYLLNCFYTAAFSRDDDGKMNSQEYKKFLARLLPEQRKKFEDLGSFEQLAGEDQLIDLDEFQQMLEKILKDVDELLKDQVRQGV